MLRFQFQLCCGIFSSRCVISVGRYFKFYIVFCFPSGIHVVKSFHCCSSKILFYLFTYAQNLSTVSIHKTHTLTLFLIKLLPDICSLQYLVIVINSLRISTYRVVKFIAVKQIIVLSKRHFCFQFYNFIFRLHPVRYNF